MVPPSRSSSQSYHLENMSYAVCAELCAPHIVSLLILTAHPKGKYSMIPFYR